MTKKSKECPGEGNDNRERDTGNRMMNKNSRRGSNVGTRKIGTEGLESFLKAGDLTIIDGNEVVKVLSM